MPDVKKIRRRVQAGAARCELADAYGVNRKTIKRRLDALELAEPEPGLQSEVEGKPTRAPAHAGTSAATGPYSRVDREDARGRASARGGASRARSGRFPRARTSTGLTSAMRVAPLRRIRVSAS